MEAGAAADEGKEARGREDDRLIGIEGAAEEKDEREEEEDEEDEGVEEAKL